MSSRRKETHVPTQKKQEISFLKNLAFIQSRKGLKIMASDNVKLHIAVAIESNSSCPHIAQILFVGIIVHPFEQCAVARSTHRFKIRLIIVD